MSNECEESSWSVLTVRPRQPFVDWANGLPDAHVVTLDDLRIDIEAYLVPASDDPGAEEAAVKRNFEAIFERQLEGWYRDRSTWPEKRTVAVFRKWFDVEFHSLVFEFPR